MPYPRTIRAPLRRLLGAAGAMVLLTACNTTPAMHVPKSTASAAAAQAAATHSVGTHSNGAGAARISPKDTRPIAFERAIIGVRYGEVIANFPAGGIQGISGTLCNYLYQGSDNTLVWSSTNRELSGWDDGVGTIFHEVMNARGFDLAGDPDALFDRQDERSRAELVIGARIEEIKGNLCEEHHWWDGRPLGKFAGEMYQRVQWAVYDVTARREVAQIATEGYARLPNPKRTGIYDLFMDSFSSAAESLGRNPKFLNAIRAGRVPETAETAERAPLDDATIVLTRVAPLTASFKRNADRITGSVVTVRRGRGHGSGFVVSADGHILTNRHVVGAADTVRVIFENGLSVEGTVVRRHKTRDVALVKVPLGGLFALPIEPTLPDVADDVFVVGSPVDEGLHSTVTRGVVSGFRTFPDDGMNYIQADAVIHGGNSGGPLFDAHGNVIGISVKGLSDSRMKLGSGIGFFIPIGEALDYLNLELTAATASKGS